jgi:hypothetical protein
MIEFVRFAGGPKMRMSWEYIAGFFDGEGHVGLGRQKRCGDGHFSRGSPRVTMVQGLERGRTLLEEIQAFLASRGINSVVQVHSEGSAHERRSYRLRITGFRGVTHFLLCVFPYLRIKKVEAQDLIRYATVFPSLAGKGHSHADNVRSAWRTRRSRYGPSGYRRTSGGANG